MTVISKIISTRHRVNGDSPPPSLIFNHLVHNFHNFHNFPNFASYTPFPGPPIEEKFELENSIEANLQEAERQLQKMTASPIPQYFQESFSVPPPHNDQPSAVETSKELLRESTLQS